MDLSVLSMFYTSFSKTHISFVLIDQLDLLFQQFLHLQKLNDHKITICKISNLVLEGEFIMNVMVDYHLENVLI